MDGNKDEALKCLKIAEAAIGSGDKCRALKFLNKARRLDPSIQSDDLLAKIDNFDSENVPSNIPSDEIPVNSAKSLENGFRRRVSAGGSSSSSTASVAYTEEQVTVVREIKRKKDYYEILGLETNCTVEDVRKAYRKLSLKVHPDKNKAPGAEEAFKMVSKAFQCLSDEESRKRYDLHGSDEPVAERRASRHGAAGMQGFNGFYGEDVDAEEIFRNFFFGGMHPVARTQFGFGFGPGMGARMGGDRGSQGFNKMVLIQLLPVLLILLLNFLTSSEPMYSLSRSYPYDHQFTTKKGVNYFVKSRDFEQKYPSGSPQRVKLEQEVENDYYSVLSHNCRLEWQQLHWGYRRDTPNCDALKRFRSVG